MLGKWPSRGRSPEKRDDPGRAVTFRRALGHAYVEARCLHDYVTYAEACGDGFVRSSTVLDWGQRRPPDRCKSNCATCGSCQRLARRRRTEVDRDALITAAIAASAVLGRDQADHGCGAGAGAGRFDHAPDVPLLRLIAATGLRRSESDQPPADGPDGGWLADQEGEVRQAPPRPARWQRHRAMDAYLRERKRSGGPGFVLDGPAHAPGLSLRPSSWTPGSEPGQATGDLSRFAVRALESTLSAERRDVARGRWTYLGIPTPPTPTGACCDRCRRQPLLRGGNDGWLLPWRCSCLHAKEARAGIPLKMPSASSCWSSSRRTNTASGPARKIGHLDIATLLEFLEHLERDRGNGVRTAMPGSRPCLLPGVPQLDLAAQVREVEEVPLIGSLDWAETRALLDAPDPGRWLAIARCCVSPTTPASGLGWSGLRRRSEDAALDEVHIIGKGRRWNASCRCGRTRRALRDWLALRPKSADRHLFLNAMGTGMTRRGFGDFCMRTACRRSPERDGVIRPSRSGSG